MGFDDVLKARREKETVTEMVNGIVSRSKIISNLISLGRDREADQKHDDLILWVRNNYTVKKDNE